jgi:flagellar hook assembly protein FlgD
MRVIILLVAAIIIGFIAGYLVKTYVYEPVPKGYVRVRIDNKSGHVVKTLALKHESGSAEVTNLNREETVHIIFKSGGENSYCIIATLDNDSVLSSKGEYVEDGYRRVETIFSNQVKTDRNTY